MPMIPTFVITLWLQGLFSFGLIGLAGYLGREWYRRSWIYDLDLNRYIFNFRPGWNDRTALLAAAVALAVWALFGGLILRGIMALASALSGGKFGGGKAAGSDPGAADPPRHERGGETRRLPRPDGSELQVELYGPEGAPTVILTHGWGANATEWYDLRRRLSERFRLIAWDLPGLGLSKQPDNKDYNLENLARDLDAVLGLAGNRPVVLLGHSIGGMISLTFCRLYPEAIGTRVAGLALVHTTYTNPVRTTKGAAFYTAIERPVIVPLLHLTIALWPLVWLWSWLSYLNGSAHLSTKRSGFAGTESWDRVEFVTSFQPHASPAVLARGMFGMLRYDATGTLPTIAIPTLVVPGDRDPVCKPDASDHMARTIPGARLAPLAPGKHMGLIEHPDRFAALVADFAAACVPASATPAGATLP